MNIIAKKSEKSKSKSYIKGHYKVLESQYDYVAELLKDNKKDTFTFVCHIISCQIFSYAGDGTDGRDGYVPIPYVAREVFCKEAEIQDLVNKGIIERLIIDEETGYTYSIEFGICTSYRMTDKVIDKYIELENISAVKYLKAPKVNLFTGKRCRSISKTKLVDENKNKQPKLIVEALTNITECLFELAPVEEHIQKLRGDLLATEVIYGKDTAEHKKARGLFYNDNGCLKNALNQNAEEVLPGFYSFTPDYSIAYTGRIHTFMQNASRKMKEAAFKNVKNLKNYDLRSSQAIGLIQQFQSANLDPTWLENYKDDKQAKYKYAELIGISVDTWKRCLCALLMGGYVPTKGTEKTKADIFHYLIEEAEGDFVKAQELLNKFSEIVEPLNIELKKWHEWLLDTYVKKLGNYSAGKLYLSNPTGKTICIDDLPRGKDLWQRKAKIAAFVLQGQEAAFIHNLTILSLNYDYKVLQNEHDGLITVGEVPKQAIQLAASRAGMDFAELEEKSFA